MRAWISTVFVLQLMMMLLLGSRAHAAAPVDGIIDARLEKVSLAGSVEVLEDPTGRLGITDVSAPQAAQRFAALDPAHLNLGYTEAAYWIRFSVRSPAATTRYLEVYQSVDDARLFQAESAGLWRERRLGRLLPFNTRSIADKNLYFPLELAAGATTTFYLRLETADTLQLGLRLLSAQELARAITTSRLISGLYLGTVGALAVYNLLIFFWLRDRAYLYYVVFQLALAALQATLDQITLQFFWPNSPIWSAHSETFFVGITLFGAAGFVRHFLTTAQRPAPFRNVLIGIQILGLMLAALFPFTSSVAFATGAIVFVGLACAALLAVGLVSWRQGSANAPFFVVAWATLLGGTVLATLTALGQLSMTGIAQESTRVGSTVEALLLSIGLAHRINRMRQEKAKAEADLLRVRTEDAARLEQRVKERTLELETALSELRSAQSRLVQQARLASLGHLVAGVVHEVGNPLNFIHGGSQDLTERLAQLEGLLTKLRGRGADPRLSEQMRETIAGACIAAELIESGNERIQQIVQNLRGFLLARPAMSEPTDIADVIRRTADLMRPNLKARGVEIELELERLPEISARSGELGQVVMNLLLNSSQAMPAGGHVRILARETRSSIEVRVEDEGPGVPPEIRDAIFDPFFTTRPPNEGTGLGLSICHQIIHQHGGDLRLEQGGPGATFVISLPKIAPECPAAHTSASS